MFVKALSLVVLLAAFLVPTAAPPGKDDFGKLVYKVPAGWTATKSGSNMKLVPNDLESGKTCEILLYPSSRRASALRSWFGNRWTEFKRGYSVKVENDILSQKDDEGHDAMLVTASLEKNGQEYLVVYMAADLPVTVETMSFVCSAELFEKHNETAEKFFKDLTFNEKAPSAPAAESPVSAPTAPPSTKPGSDEAPDPGTLGKPPVNFEETIPAPAPMPAGTLAEAAKSLANRASKGDYPALLRAMLASGLSIKDLDCKSVLQPVKGEATGFSVNHFDLQNALQGLSDEAPISQADFLEVAQGPDGVGPKLAFPGIMAEIEACAKSTKNPHKFWGLFIRALLSQNAPGEVDMLSATLILQKLARNYVFAVLRRTETDSRLGLEPGDDLQDPAVINDSLVNEVMDSNQVPAKNPNNAAALQEMSTELWSSLIEAQSKNPSLGKLTYAQYVVTCALVRHVRSFFKPGGTFEPLGPLVRTKTKGQDGGRQNHKLYLSFIVSEQNAAAFNKYAAALGLKSRLKKSVGYGEGAIEVTSSIKNGPRRDDLVLTPGYVKVLGKAGGKLEVKGAVQDKSLVATSPPDDFEWLMTWRKRDLKLPPELQSSEFSAIWNLYGAISQQAADRQVAKGNYELDTTAVDVRDWLETGWKGKVEITVVGEDKKTPVGKIVRGVSSEISLADGMPSYGIPRVLAYKDMQEQNRFYTWRNPQTDIKPVVADNGSHTLEFGCLSSEKVKTQVTITSKPERPTISDVRVILQHDKTAGKVWVKLEGGTSIPATYTKTFKPVPKGVKSPQISKRYVDLFEGSPYKGDRAIFEVPLTDFEAGKITIQKTLDVNFPWEYFNITGKLKVHITLTNSKPPGGFLGLLAGHGMLMLLAELHRLQVERLPDFALAEDEMATCYSSLVADLKERTPLKHARSNDQARR